MKTIIKLATIIAATIFTTFNASAQPELYKKYSSSPGMTKVYISPTMMQLIGVAAVSETVDSDNIDLAAIATKINELYLLSTKNEDVVQNIGKDFDKLIAGKSVELLMEASDSGDNMYIYCERVKDVISAIYIRILEPDECTVIMLTGSFTKENIQSIMTHH